MISRVHSRRSALKIVLFAALVTRPILLPAQVTDRLQEIEDKLRTVTEELNALKAGKATAEDAAPARAGQARQPGIRTRFSEGIHFEDPDGDWSLRVGGRVQLDYRHFSPGGAIANTFSVRRARAGIDATVYEDFRIVVEAEYANGTASGTTPQNVALTLGYFDLGILGPAARFRLGQFKPAFGYEQTIPDLYSDYMERSLAQSLLQNLNYDRGLMLYGVPARGLWYGVTVANGSGQNLEEKQSSAQEVEASKPELVARLTGNLAPMREWAGKIAQAGLSYRKGEVANSAATPYSAASVQTEARGITFFTPGAFNSTGQSASNVDRAFIGVEFLMAAKNWKLQGEHAEVAYQGTRTSPAPALDYTRRLKAHYLSLMWLVTGEHYADFFRDSVITKIRPRQRFARGAAGGWGALELGLRYSAFDGSDFAPDNPVRTGQLSATAPTSTGTLKARALTVQAKWIPNVFSRFWLNVVRTEFDTPVIVNGLTASHEQAYLLRAQIDF